MTRAPYRIAVLMDIAFSEFQIEPMRGIQRFAYETDIEIVYFGIGALDKNYPEDWIRLDLIEFISPEEFDGLIIISTSFHNPEGREILKEKLQRLQSFPIVSIGSSIMGEDVLYCDNSQGMRQIMEHLIHDHGYKRFAFVSGPFSHSDASARLSAFKECLDEAGIEHSEKNIFEGYFISPSGFQAVQVFLDERKLKPEVIVCANDFMALGVWNALKERGINIPYDIAVTGFDDTQMSRALSHQFTTAHQSFDLLGYKAAQTVVNKINNNTTEYSLCVPAELRIRSSCGCVDIEHRKFTELADSPKHILDTIKGNIVSSYSDKVSDEEVHELFRDWTDTVYTALNQNRPVYEIEMVLREVRSIIEQSNSHKPVDYKILHSLYALMLEQCGQIVFVEYWRERFFSMQLRVLLDQIQEHINRTLSLEESRGLFTEIMKFIEADSVFFFLFNNLKDVSSGASIVYATDNHWKTNIAQHGSWLPPRGSGSFVCNIISDDENRFGYFLISAGIPSLTTYEYLRIRFNNIGRDFMNLQNVQKLNDDLMYEVGERRNAEEQLKKALSLVEKLSIEDELTGLYNRRGFFQAANRQIKYLRREETTFFILYADMDGLKVINDKYGHKDGDLAIKSLSEVFTDALRESDIVCRLGGDEFTILISSALEKHYDAIKKRINKYCRKKQDELKKPWELSMSIGRFFSDVDCTYSLDKMLEMADQDLYEEKLKRKQTV